MKKMTFIIFSSMLFLNGCQLPDRAGIDLNKIPTLDATTIISSDNGLLSDGLSKVPGSICIVDKTTGKCDQNNLHRHNAYLEGQALKLNL